MFDFTHTLNDLEYSLVTDYLLSIIHLNNTLSKADIDKVLKVILISVTVIDHEFRHI